MSPWLLVVPGVPLLGCAYLYLRLWLARRTAVAATKDALAAAATRDVALANERRLEEENRALKREAELGRKRWAALSREHPDLARGFFVGVLEDAATPLPDPARDATADPPA